VGRGAPLFALPDASDAAVDGGAQNGNEAQTDDGPGLPRSGIHLEDILQRIGDGVTSAAARRIVLMPLLIRLVLSLGLEAEEADEGDYEGLVEEGQVAEPPDQAAALGVVHPLVGRSLGGGRRLGRRRGGRGRRSTGRRRSARRNRPAAAGQEADLLPPEVHNRHDYSIRFVLPM